MTKENWLKHMEEVSGLPRPSEVNDGTMLSQKIDALNNWKRAYVIHKQECPNCAICKARLATKRATRNRKDREECFKSAGLTKVYGAVSGRVYWE